MSAAYKCAGVAAACIFVGGCAAVDVQRVESYDQHGVRYWRPAPYVAVGPVVANGTTTCQASMVMLPDKSEEYAITLNTGLWGTASANPTLADGWNLTGLNASADSKTSEVLGSIASILNAGALKPAFYTPGAKPSPGTPTCAQGLYRVEFDRYGRISGLTRVVGSGAFGFVAPAPKPAPNGGDDDDKDKDKKKK